MHINDHTTDNELVQLSLENQDNFLYLIERYEKKLLHYIMRISGVKYEDAEDILQEVFIKVYYNLNGFSQELKFSSWIYRITHNETISELRKKKSRPVSYYDEADLINLADAFSADNFLDKKIQQDEIRSILSKLPEKYRDVLILKFLEEKDYNEISDILKKPVGTVGTLINRAKKLFKKQSKYWELRN